MLAGSTSHRFRRDLFTYKISFTPSDDDHGEERVHARYSIFLPREAWNYKRTWKKSYETQEKKGPDETIPETLVQIKVDITEPQGRWRDERGGQRARVRFEW